MSAMNSNMKLLAGVAAAGVALYAFVNHQKNKNVLDKASDSLESTRYDMRQRAGDSSLGTAASKAYYDAKESARK